MSNKKNITERQCIELFAKLSDALKIDYQLHTAGYVPCLPNVELYCQFIETITIKKAYSILAVCSTTFAENLRIFALSYISTYKKFEEKINKINYYHNYLYFVDRETKDQIEAARNEVHSYDEQLPQLLQELAVLQQSFPFRKRKDVNLIAQRIEGLKTEIKAAQGRWNDSNEQREQLLISYKSYGKNYYRTIYNLCINIMKQLDALDASKTSTAIVPSKYFEYDVAAKFHSVCNGEQLKTVNVDYFYNAVNDPQGDKYALLPLPKEIIRIYYLIYQMSKFVSNAESQNEWVQAMLKMLKFDYLAYSKKHKATIDAEDKRSKGFVKSLAAIQNIVLQ